MRKAGSRQHNQKEKERQQRAQEKRHRKAEKRALKRADRAQMQPRNTPGTRLTLCRPLVQAAR
jgi:hypothetical protein